MSWPSRFLIFSKPCRHNTFCYSYETNKSDLLKCPFIMMTEPVLIALFAYINSVLPAPLDGKVINECEVKKTRYLRRDSGSILTSIFSE